MIPMMWLNTACLGQTNTVGGNTDAVVAGERLRAAFRRCIRWVATNFECDPR